MNTIIVTGITGFVGSNLLKAFTTKFNIIGISRNSNLIQDCITYEEYYSINQKTNYGLVHLAGKAHDLKKVSDEKDYIEANYILTKKVFDKFLSDDLCKHFIFLSSVKAVADSVNDVLFEDVAYNPTTSYGKSKMMAEKYILGNLPNNKSVYILRPCMVHGPGNKGNLNLFYSLAKNGIPYPLAAFENKRSFLTVDNLLFVIENLLKGNAPSGIYNVADDEAFSTNQVFKLIGGSMDKKTKLIKVPRVLINLIAIIGDKINLPLNTERLQKLTENFIVSNKKIKDALKVEFPFSAKEGLMRTFDSFKKTN